MDLKGTAKKIGKTVYNKIKIPAISFRNYFPFWSYSS